MNKQEVGQKHQQGLDLSLDFVSGVLVGLNIGSIMQSFVSSTAVYAMQISNLVPKEKKIGVVTGAGFELDMNNMQTGKKYLVDYDGSKYEVLRNEKNELELYEIA